MVASDSRRDRPAFFAEGYRLLGDRSFEGLTVAALCNRLGTTKGSFYHHFEDLPSYVDELAGRWQDWLVEMFNGWNAEPDLRRRYECVANGSYPIMKPGAVAMRAWAHTNSTVATAMAAPHLAARALAVGILAEHAEDEDTGQVLAAMIAPMCVGLQHRARLLDREHYMRIIAAAFSGLGIGNDLMRRGGQPLLRALPSARLAPVSTEPGLFVVPTPEGALRSSDRAGTVPEAYFVGAWELLAEQGSDALTSRALAERVGLTKGSFRHHFGTMPEFEQDLAGHWEQRETARLARLHTAGGPLRRLELLLEDLLVRPNPATSVWRAWGYANPAVGRAVRRVDHRFELALTSAIADVSGRDDAGALAEMTAGFAQGLHRWYPPFEPDIVARASVEWMRRILGVDAEIGRAAGHPALVFSRV